VLAAESSRAHAQAIPKSSSTTALKDTIIIASFHLYNGATGVAGQAVTLNHRLAGNLEPSQFRVSKFADFRDATWQAYSGSVPRWTSPSFDGSCSGTGAARLTAYFQVRATTTARQQSTTFVMSNIARDTACVLIGG
jgi:hypothetical protein